MPPKEDIYRRVGLNIRGRRLSLGMTLEDLADRAARHPTYVGQIELGRKQASLATLAVLARALEVPVREFFDAEPARGAAPLARKIDSLLRSRPRDERELLLGVLRYLSGRIRALRLRQPRAHGR